MPRKKRSASPIISYDEFEDDFEDEVSSNGSRNGGQNPPIQRNAANARERARMRVLSSAFCRLKTKLPWVPADTKLSKLDTLRLATIYIQQLRASLSTDKLDSNIMYSNCMIPTSQSLVWPFTFQQNIDISTSITTPTTITTTTTTTSITTNNNNTNNNNITTTSKLQFAMVPTSTPAIGQNNWLQQSNSPRNISTLDTFISNSTSGNQQQVHHQQSLHQHIPHQPNHSHQHHHHQIQQTNTITRNNFINNNNNNNHSTAHG